MKEFIGNCRECGKELFCLDGFFNGVVGENDTNICFDCADPESSKNTNENP